MTLPSVPVRLSYLRKVVFALIGSSVLLHGAHATSNPEYCTTIVDEAARLGCYDSFFKPAQAALPTQDTLEVLSSEALAAMAPLESRLTQELALTKQRFALTPHKPNYILPMTYNGNADYSSRGDFGDLFSDSEVKLQLSLKTRIIPDLWGDSSVWFAYTQQSYWQLYADSDASAPFRETNHQPEIFWQLPVDFNVFGWTARVARLAINHQSNGRSEPLSRSWNRVTGELILEHGSFVASAKAWHRIEEDSDNNPNIEDFMGRVQLGLAFRHNKQTFAVNIKNNLSSNNRSGVELNWSFPLFQKVHGFIQVYSGFGENLIDMESNNKRIGIGIALTEWL